MATEVPGRREAQTLREVISRLGPSLVTVAVAPDGTLDRFLAGVSVHDPLLEVPEGRGEALLAVGVDPNGADAVSLSNGRRHRATPPSCCTSTTPYRSQSHSRRGGAASRC